MLVILNKNTKNVHNNKHSHLFVWKSVINYIYSYIKMLLNKNNMATNRPFAYNPSLLSLAGTINVGNISNLFAKLFLIGPPNTVIFDSYV